MSKPNAIRNVTEYQRVGSRSRPFFHSLELRHKSVEQKPLLSFEEASKGLEAGSILDSCQRLPRPVLLRLDEPSDLRVTTEVCYFAQALFLGHLHDPVIGTTLTSIGSEVS